MDDAKKAALRGVLDQAVDSTIAGYHGFMESSVHSKAEALLNTDWRSKLVDDMAAAIDATAGTQ